MTVGYLVLLDTENVKGSDYYKFIQLLTRLEIHGLYLSGTLISPGFFFIRCPNVIRQFFYTQDPCLCYKKFHSITYTYVRVYVKYVRVCARTCIFIHMYSYCGLLLVHIVFEVKNLIFYGTLKVFILECKTLFTEV